MLILLPEEYDLLEQGMELIFLCYLFQDPFLTLPLFSMAGSWLLKLHFLGFLDNWLLVRFVQREAVVGDCIAEGRSKAISTPPSKSLAVPTFSLSFWTTSSLQSYAYWAASATFLAPTGHTQFLNSLDDCNPGIEPTTIFEHTRWVCACLVHVLSA